MGRLSQIEVPEFDAMTVCGRGEQGESSSYGFSLSEGRPVVWFICFFADCLGQIS